MGRKIITIIASLTLPVSFLLAMLTPGIANASTGWQIIASPDPGGGSSGVSLNVFSGVSCTSASSCEAVGTYSGATTGGTLAAHWNGTSWEVQTTAADTGNLFSLFEGVKCVTSAACTAVGFTEDDSTGTSTPKTTLAERWNGTAWSVQPTPNPAGTTISQLTAVACTTTTNCIAVGVSDNQPLAEHWNGSSWALQAVPAVSGGRLVAISCTSASACTAVGGSSPGALILRWNGASWKTQTATTPSGSTGIGFSGVKCTSGSLCTAVGSAAYVQAGVYYQKTLAERWNGTSWKVQSTPNPAESGFLPHDSLTAISCTSTSACTAVGDRDFSTLAEHWNGTSWKVQPTPDVVGELNSLLGVSCTAATTCMAVGEYDGGTGSSPVFTLAMRHG
jgi:hypothetical protein